MVAIKDRSLAARGRYGFFTLISNEVKKPVTAIRPYRMRNVVEKAFWNVMKEAGLFSRYTMHELLDELDVVECFTEPGKAPMQGKVLKKQEQIYVALGVTPLPASPEVMQ